MLPPLLYLPRRYRHLPAAPAVAEFAPITSQEDLNRTIAERIAREKSKYADYGDLQAKAARLAEIEESQKTESQKLADATAKAQREADEARSETTRYKVAATHGVGADYFELLGSGDEATVTARAEKLAPLLAAQTENAQLKAEIEALKTGKPSPLSGRPIVALKPGATPEESKSEGDLLYQSLFGSN